MDTKYIITRDYGPIIFPATLSHRDVAFAICKCVPERITEQVMSAGFLNVAVGYEGDKEHERAIISVHCFGESTSLGGIKSQEDDEKLITRVLSPRW